MHDISKIEERAKQAKQLAREIAELNQAESTLCGQKAELTAALAQYAPSGFILDDQGANGDPETDARLAQLSRLNTKLDLLPGIRSRLQQDLAGIERELAMGLELTLADARRQAREQMDALREKLARQFLPLCGDDSKRAALAADAVITQSEAHSWYEAFKSNVLIDGASAAEKLQGLIKHVARFNAGETIRTK